MQNLVFQVHKKMGDGEDVEMACQMKSRRHKTLDFKNFKDGSCGSGDTEYLGTLYRLLIFNETNRP